MKNATNDNNSDGNSRPLIPAELETLRQHEAGNEAGPAGGHPRVEHGRPALDRVRFREEIGYCTVLIVPILKGRYTVEGGRWWCREGSGVPMPVDSPLEEAATGCRGGRS